MFFCCTSTYVRNVCFFVVQESNSNVGYPIHVFQESIHQGFDEYLVHEIYLRRLMTAYGFMLVSNEVAQKIVGIPKGTATFEELFASFVPK